MITGYLVSLHDQKLVSQIRTDFCCGHRTMPFP
jgi:hypothetical protein